MLTDEKWIRRKNHGQKWLQGRLSYGGGNSTIENVVFQGTTGSLFLGDIALG